MKLRDKLSTVFLKLFLSYAALLLVTMAAVGVATQIYFTKNYNEEIEKVHDKMLLHTDELLETTVLGKAEQIYIDLINDPDVMYLFDHSLAGNQVKVLDIRQFFKNAIRLYPDVVESISVYYKDRQIVVSSSHGLVYLDETSGKSTMSTDWIEVMERGDRNSLWLGTRNVPVNAKLPTESSEVVSYIRSYPYRAQQDEAEGYVAIQVKASALRDLIRSGSAADRGQELIVDSDGMLIAAGGGGGQTQPDWNARLADLTASMKEPQGSMRYAADDGSYFLSYRTMESTGWKLVQATPVDQFYQKSYAIQRNMLLICLLAALLGLALANVLTRNMYNPLKKLLHSVRKLFDGSLQQPAPRGNEYTQLDRMVVTLSDKMNELQAAVRENVPLIKHNLITGLLYNTIPTEPELADRLRLLGLQWGEAGYCVLVFKPDEAQSAGVGHEKRHVMLYNLVRELERLSGPEAECLAAIADHAVCAVIRSEREDEAALYRLERSLREYASRQFGISAVSGIGPWVGKPLELHRSFRLARRYMTYRFVYPELGVFGSARFREREEDAEAGWPAGIRERFEEALKTRKPDEARLALDGWLEELRTGAYSLGRCLESCRGAIDVYDKFVKDAHLRTGSPEEEGLRVELDAAGDIRLLRDRFHRALGLAFERLRERNCSKSADIVQRVKSFVDDNLHKELGLLTAAEHVELNASYLSQLFKEETGGNYVDYVTQRRIEAAARMIAGSDLKIEEVAKQVGYNSTTYFIKKFKQVYGITPGTYKADFVVQTGK